MDKTIFNKLLSNHFVGETQSEKQALKYNFPKYQATFKEMFNLNLSRQNNLTKLETFGDNLSKIQNLILIEFGKIIVSENTKAGPNEYRIPQSDIIDTIRENLRHEFSEETNTLLSPKRLILDILQNYLVGKWRIIKIEDDPNPTIVGNPESANKLLMLLKEPRNPQLSTIQQLNRQLINNSFLSFQDNPALKTWLEDKTNNKQLVKQWSTLEPEFHLEIAKNGIYVSQRTNTNKLMTIAVLVAQGINDGLSLKESISDLKDKSIIKTESLKSIKATILALNLCNSDFTKVTPQLKRYFVDISN